MDKGEAQMTFYQVKKLLKDLQKGLIMLEFWRLVEQVTRQKPKLPQPGEGGGKAFTSVAT